MSQKNTNQPEYGTELKRAAVRRVLAGESVSAVAQGLGIRRKRAVCVDGPVMQSWAKPVWRIGEEEGRES